MFFAVFLVRGRRMLWALALCVGAFCIAAPTVAKDEKAEQGDRLSAYRHDRWMNFEGAPSSIQAINQTPDGWIWLATADGLFRFDGLIFEEIPPQAGSSMEQAKPTALLVTRSGELWVGYGQNGGIAKFHKGTLREVPMPFRPFRVSSMAQTPDGAIWAVPNGADYPNHSLMRFAEGRWDVNADDHLHLTDGAPWQLCVSGDGTLWVTLALPDKMMLASLRPGSDRFITSSYRPVGSRCYADRQGRIWTAHNGPLLTAAADGREITDKTSLPMSNKQAPFQFIFDADGGYWGLTRQSGLHHLPHAIPGQNRPNDDAGRFDKTDGLSSELMFDVFADRDDNIWIGTGTGLDRFRRASAVHEPALSQFPGDWLGIGTSAGRVYITNDVGIHIAAPGRPVKLFDKDPSGLCMARGGGAWFMLDDGIRHMPGDGSQDFPLPSGMILSSECTEDRFGRFWVTGAAGELQWHDGNGWHRPKASMPTVHLWDIIPTPAGDVAYTTTTDLVQIVGNKIVKIPLAQYGVGGITNISAGLRDLFVSGSGALLRIRGTKVSRIETRRFPWVSTLRGLLQTPRGETWLMQDSSISRVSTADLDRAFEDDRVRLDRRLFDARDGVLPAQPVTMRGLQMAADGQGRIWQLSRYGVTYIDPALLRSDTAPPPVMIRSLTAGGKLHRDPSAMVLPPGTGSIDIAYTALSYAHPERVRFRYRLEGVDESWVDPGDRRIASYANLGPGRYHFQVIASDNQRTWSKPATLAVEIRPSFFQSWPFKVLCGIAVLALLWLAYTLRLRTVAARIRARMAERVAERERIARELHDTLLQSVQSLTLRFQLAADELPEQAPARQALESAIDQADQVIAEGRDRVRDLRPVNSAGTLEQIILDIVARQAFDPAVEVTVETEGAEHTLDPLVLDEVMRIASEAIFNIWRHADARRVTIVIAYATGLHLRITDDGNGTPPDVILAGGKPSHFGLSGMRERALKLKGNLAVRSPASGGTEVTLTIPGAIAYKASARNLLALLGLSTRNGAD